MVDKLDLGSSAFGVRVRLPSPAQIAAFWLLFVLSEGSPFPPASLLLGSPRWGHCAYTSFRRCLSSHRIARLFGTAAGAAFAPSELQAPAQGALAEGRHLILAKGVHVNGRGKTPPLHRSAAPDGGIAPNGRGKTPPLRRSAAPHVVSGRAGQLEPEEQGYHSLEETRQGHRQRGRPGCHGMMRQEGMNSCPHR